MEIELYYARLYRKSTESYITYQLERSFKWSELELWIEGKFPAWELVSASVENPDDEMVT